MAKKKKIEFNLKHKPFWAVMAAVLVLCVVGILCSVDNNSSLTGNAAVQPLALMDAGESISFEVRNTPGFKGAIVTAAEDIKNAVIEFKELETVSWPFEGVAYTHLKISSKDESKIASLQLTLKIKETEIKQLGLNLGDIGVYLDGEELVTILTEETRGYAFYSATTTKLGEFVIGKQTVAKEIVVVEEPEGLLEVEETPPVGEPEPTGNEVSEGSGDQENLPEPEELPGVEETQVVEELEVKEGAEPLVGKAAEQEVSEGLFSNVLSFFKGIFN